MQQRLWLLKYMYLLMVMYSQMGDSDSCICITQRVLVSIVSSGYNTIRPRFMDFLDSIHNSWDIDLEF